MLKASQELLDIPAGLIESAIEAEVIEEHIVPETIQAQACYYPVSLYQAETRVAAKLKHLVTGQPPWGTIDLAKALPWVEAKTGLSLAESQRHAIETVLRAKVSIITGGPGVGKTTLVNSLIQILLARKVPLGLCAPTGRAAKRLSETTGLTAKTIHRLLDFDPKTFGFKHHQDNPLPINVLIIDEASMIDIVLMNHLLKAVSSTTAVIFVGDIDQLPSVGPGAVLANLIQSQLITTVRLTEVFRQAAHSHIILNAHRINQGQLPLPNAAQQGDFFTLYESTPEAIHQTVLEVVTQRLPTHYHCDPKQTIQVLTPMNRGGLGSRALNASLQAALNGKAEPKLQRFGSLFSPGDKVIQMTNNYDKEVFNGDIGFIERIDLEEGEVSIRFDQAIKTYETGELDELQLAYAISIHKSQGSEFPIVVIPLAMQHYTLLARNLLYTAVTRGRQLVVLIGQKKAIGMAVNNNKEANRLTQLAERLSAR